MSLSLATLALACSQSTPPPNQPPQRMDNFTMTQTVSGRTLWRLQSPEATISLQGQARLTLPLIDFYDKGSHTSAKAKEAFVRGDSRDMALQGDVVIVSSDDQTTLKTERLQYIAKLARFHTDDPVTVIREGSILHGRGMDADQRLRDIRVYHQNTRMQ